MGSHRLGPARILHIREQGTIFQNATCWLPFKANQKWVPPKPPMPRLLMAMGPCSSEAKAIPLCWKPSGRHGGYTPLETTSPKRGHIHYRATALDSSDETKPKNITLGLVCCIPGVCHPNFDSGKTDVVKVTTQECRRKASPVSRFAS